VAVENATIIVSETKLIINFDYFNLMIRQKVDLTKYIEQHSFHFDAAYGADVSN